MRIFHCDLASSGECCFGTWQSPYNHGFFSSPIAIDPERDEDQEYYHRENGVCELFLQSGYISEADFEYEIDYNGNGDGGVPNECPIYQGETDPPQWKGK